MLLGIDGDMLRELTAEYAKLKPLFAATADEEVSHRIIGTMNLHAKLKRILDELQQMEFRPFSTYYQLAIGTCGFSSMYFKKWKADLLKKQIMRSNCIIKL